MVSPNLLLPLLFFLFATSSHLSLGLDRKEETTNEGIVGAVTGRRMLMSFKETPNGGNLTFDCSPSGPCVPCAYSEKNDEKYRCSETGYRIPLKCVEIRPDSKVGTSKKHQKGRSVLGHAFTKVPSQMTLHEAEQSRFSVAQRSLLDNISASEDGLQAYIIYRSCILSVNEEKLSVLGFEGIIMGLLFISGSVIYFRRKRVTAVPGVMPARVPNSSRF